MERPQFHGTHFEDFESTVSGELIKTKTSVKTSSKSNGKGKGKGSNKGEAKSGLRGKGYDGDGGAGGVEDGDGAELRKAYPIWRRLVR